MKSQLCQNVSSLVSMYEKKLKKNELKKFVVTQQNAETLAQSPMFVEDQLQLVSAENIPAQGLVPITLESTAPA